MSKGVERKLSEALAQIKALKEQVVVLESLVFAEKYDALRASHDRLKHCLELLYDKWENGVPCHEANEGQIDENSSFIGNAVKLSFGEEQEILTLIIDKAESHEAACANCGKPYRAHLLHDKNKCAPEGEAAWFPSSIAASISRAEKAGKQ